jgi:hypothetical protein
MESKTLHLMYVPWTGLGLYGGFRGNRWLKNRIKVFKQFVLPSLEVQTNQNFAVWCSWRPEEKSNPYVKELMNYMEAWGDLCNIRVIHTFHGVCFWDDKYTDDQARNRLASAIHGSVGELYNHIGEADTILMTIQPSDDCYNSYAVEEIQNLFKITDLQAVGYKHGYMMDYIKGEVSEYNPTTNPPFFTIKFPRNIFTDPLAHMEYTGPYKSHEYVGDKLNYFQIPKRGFLVGTHSENISTVYSHPFRGQVVERAILREFGLYDTSNLEIRTSIRRAILKRLPWKIQRKIRYWIGERFWQGLYEFLRG